MHTLQELLLEAPSGREALYWHMAMPPGSHPAVANPGLAAPAGALVRLDTLCNSFYERYWRDLTNVSALALEIKTTGRVTIRVHRVLSDRREVLSQLSTDGTRCVSTLLTSFDDGTPRDAVIEAEIEVHDGGAVIHGGRWATPTLPSHAVRLAIVVCSFGREAILAATLGRIAETVATTRAIMGINVVQQGGMRLEEVPQIADLQSRDAFGGKLKLFRQANFGGAGGFTRGMIEALATEATHVLLLDDDIELEPHMLGRLCKLLGYVPGEVVIGGQMLSLAEPTKLAASHEAIDFSTLTASNPLEGVDLGREAVSALFAKRHISGYNGWWFCCIPTPLVRRAGLPLPLFIHHDDTEYGVRLGQAGATVVTMPGLFVWHEPFKPGRTPWISYFDRRNIMIAGAVRGIYAPKAALNWYWRDVCKAMAEEHFWFIFVACLAVEDFLSGPAAAYAMSEEKVHSIRSQCAVYALLSVTRLRHRRGDGLASARPRSLRATLSALCWDACSSDRNRARTARLALRLNARALVAALRLLLQGARVAAAYKASTTTYTSVAFWRRHLELDGGLKP